MPALTDREQQELICYIEADRLLPERCRFLLLVYKREAVLVRKVQVGEVCSLVLHFQVIQQVHEPRAEKPEETELQMDLFLLDPRGPQLKGGTNKLICGDNKLLLSSLKNGPLREKSEKQGGHMSSAPRVTCFDPSYTALIRREG